MPNSLDNLPDDYFRKYHPPATLNEVLRQVLYTNPEARQKLLEARIRTLWRSKNPPYVSALTGRIMLSNGVLRIEIKNAGLRANLSLRRDAIRNRINELLEKPLIHKLLFF